MDELIGSGATRLRALAASGEVSAVEIADAHIARIEAVNPKLNAVVVKRYDAARAEAREADRRRAAGEALGPLHGVPVTIKECLDLTGTPSTFGFPSRATTRTDADERHVARLREAGAIVLGKTNVAQMLLFVESDNPLYGRTDNPWNPARSCGGSSGGEGAILASGGAALGLGTDIGGSVRVPAAFCGIASLKPTAGRCPDLGRFSVPLGQQAVPSQVGVMARDAADVALGLAVISDGNEPPTPFGDPAAVDVSRLRVAVHEHDGTLSAAPAARRAVREAADGLRAAGVQVTPWTPPDVPHALDLYFGLLSAGGSRLRETAGGDPRDPRLAQLLFLAGRSNRILNTLGRLASALGQKTLGRTLAVFGERSASDYWRLIEAADAYRVRFAQALDREQGGPFDAILAPACALPAVPHGSAKDLSVIGGYTALYNILGYPAGVVPFTRVGAHEETERAPSRDIVEKVAAGAERGSAGLPIGVQIIARPWRDHVALALMMAIQDGARRRSDYPDRPPI